MTHVEPDPSRIPEQYLVGAGMHSLIMDPADMRVGYPKIISSTVGMQSVTHIHISKSRT